MAYARARAMSGAEVPVIDITALRDGSDAAGVGRKLAWAASEIGFIYASGHGVPQAVIDHARAAGLAFFRAPVERKRAVSTNAHHHGWLAPGETVMSDGARVDLKESFNFGLEIDGAAPATSNPLLGPNEWPAGMPELKAALLPWYAAASACAVDILRGFAIAAELPEHTFTARSQRPVSRGSLQYYPPQPEEMGEEQFGVAAHTDFGMLTVLAQDAVGGLQLQDLAGEWLAVPPIAGTLVINVGDLLARWSNERYRSTPHRVINASGRERLSLVLAYDPDFDTAVEPAMFTRDGEAPRHPATTVGEYLMWRFRKAFAYRQ